MVLSKRQIRALFVIGMVLGAASAGLVTALFLSNSVSVSGPVPVVAADGPNATITGSADVNLTDPFPDSHTVELNTSGGNITFVSDGPTDLAIAATEINGTWTNVSQLDVSTNELEVRPEDKPAFNISGDADNVSIRQGISLDDGQVDFVYGGPDGTTTTLTLRSLPANTNIRAVDASSGTLLGFATSDGSGKLSIQLDQSTHAVTLQTFSASAPVQSDASPTGEISDTPSELSVDINDRDFPSDEIMVNISLDGTEIHGENITSNGTVTTSNFGTLSLGEHNWTVNTTDQYGLHKNQTYSFELPKNVTFRKELAPDELVNNAQVNITAFYSGEVEERNVNNGELNLTGFPVDEPIIFSINTSGYYTRTVVIEDIHEQSDIYLLNSSEPVYVVRFNLQDPTGSYPREDTALFVDRALNQSDATEWRTITGDRFGVEGIPTNLDQDVRFRIRIKNLENGNLAVIGSYTAIQSESVTINAGTATVPIPSSQREYAWSFEENETGQYIRFEYEDEADQTEEVKVTIHERFNDSNVLVDNVTFTNSNNIVYQESLTADETNSSWMAELYIDRGDGFQHFRVPITGGPRSLIPGGLDSVWVEAIGVFILLISAMAFSQLNQGVGAITTSLTGGLLWWLGVLSGAAVGPAVVLAIGVSVVFHYKQGGVPS